MKKLRGRRRPERREKPRWLADFLHQTYSFLRLCPSPSPPDWHVHSGHIHHVFFLSSLLPVHVCIVTPLWQVLFFSRGRVFLQGDIARNTSNDHLLSALGLAQFGSAANAVGLRQDSRSLSHKSRRSCRGRRRRYHHLPATAPQRPTDSAASTKDGQINKCSAQSRMIHSAHIGPRLALHLPAVLERSQEKFYTDRR